MTWPAGVAELGAIPGAGASTILEPATCISFVCAERGAEKNSGSKKSACEYNGLELEVSF